MRDKTSPNIQKETSITEQQPQNEKLMKYTLLLLAAGIPSISLGSVVVAVIDTGADGITPGSLAFNAGGSWTGNGTVQPFDYSFPTAPAGGNPAAPGGMATLVTGASSGSLVLTGTRLGGAANANTPAGFTTTHAFDIVGGTSDLVIALASAAPGNASNWSLTPSAGATSITWTTTYSTPVNSRRRTANNQVPWLGSLQMPGSANAQITIGGISTWTSPTGLHADATSTPGIAGGIGAANISGRSLTAITEPTPGTLTYFQTAQTDQTHINSIIPVDVPNIHAASSAGAYNAAAYNDNNLNDGERVVADSITWVLRPDGDEFIGNEEFIFSFDGGLPNPPNPPVVPEPTSIALLGLGGLALLRRKRA